MSGWGLIARVMAGLTLVFLIAPLLVIVPLSFNAEPFFTFTDRMLALDPDGYSTRWYQAILNDTVRRDALVNSLIIGGASTAREVDAAVEVNVLVDAAILTNEEIQS